MSETPQPAPLLIPSALRDAMVEHCRRESPLECCGVLVGTVRTASSIAPFRNTKASESRYEADPAEVIEVVRSMRLRGEEFVAIYHSHPRWRAVPSRADLDLNYYGDLPRIIVGLIDDPPDIRAWHLLPDTFTEIPITWMDPAVEAGKQRR